MQMELMNNQITRMQGIHSLRETPCSYGLFLIAENIDIDCTVLDFPRWKGFTQELKNGYTHVGISFVGPNVLKAKRMAEYVRKHHPEMQIILGGFGTLLPDIKEILPYDHLSDADGVAWFRNFFHKQIYHDQLKHPLFRMPPYTLYGYSAKMKSSVIIPGLGCVNHCDFCATSAFFQGYIPILKTGKDLYNFCERAEKEIGATGFFILDENFLKNRTRAIEFLDLLTTNQKNYGFDLFSSMETIQALGVDFLIRLGVRTLWIGVESEKKVFPKNTNINKSKIVSELQENGIHVIASMILFLDHHTPEGLQKDIDWAIGLNSDYIQFMNYTACPTTPLYLRLKKAKLLDATIPYEELHGSGKINFRHPHFSDPVNYEEILRKAYLQKYHAHGPSNLNVALTALKGYIKIAREAEQRKEQNYVWNKQLLKYEPAEKAEEDIFMQLRLEKMRRRCLRYQKLLYPVYLFAPNKNSRKKAKNAMTLYRQAFGPLTLKEKLFTGFLTFCAMIEQIRYLLSRAQGRESLIRQPKTVKKTYKAKKRD